MPNKPVADCPCLPVEFAVAASPGMAAFAVLNGLKDFRQRRIARALAEPDPGPDCVDELAVTGADL